MNASDRLKKYSRERNEHIDDCKRDGEKDGEFRSRWIDYLPYVRTPSSIKKPEPCSTKAIKVAVVPDTHVPRQEKKAWSTALGLIKDFKPDAVVIIGDFGDFESISHHPKNRPDLTKFATECYETNLALDSLQGSAPNASFYYVEGNHEYRAVKYVNAFPHLDGLLSVPENLYILPPGSHKPIPSTTLRNASSSRVHVDLRGITWIPFRNYLRRAWVSPWGCGYMHSAKGNGSWGSGGVNHASYHANNVGPVTGCKTVVYGHHHTFQSFRTAAGYDAFCCGFLGDFDADEPAFDYAGGPQPWVTGMMFQEFSGSLVSNEQVHISSGRALFRGKLFK